MPLLGKKLKNRLAGAFLLIGGVGLLATGLWIAIANATFIGHAERAPGTVIEVVGERNPKGTKLYHPLVRYEPMPGGASVTFKAEPGMWPSPFDVGETVTVAYDRDDPSDANIVSFWTLWMLPLTLLAFGIGCLIAGRHTLIKGV